MTDYRPHSSNNPPLKFSGAPISSLLTNPRHPLDNDHRTKYNNIPTTSRRQPYTANNHKPCAPIGRADTTLQPISTADTSRRPIGTPDTERRPLSNKKTPRALPLERSVYFFLARAACGITTLTRPGKFRVTSSRRTDFTRSRSRGEAALSARKDCTAVLAALPFLPALGVSLTLNLPHGRRGRVKPRVTTVCGWGRGGRLDQAPLRLFIIYFRGVEYIGVQKWHVIGFQCNNLTFS